MAAKDAARGSAWERAGAAMFGFRRRRKGETYNGKDDCVLLDGSLAPLSLECKSYQRLMLLTADINQARRNAGDRPWILAQRPKGWRRPIGTVDLEWLRDVCVLAGLIDPPTNQPEETHDQGAGQE